jgi:hypothetical protein
MVCYFRNLLINLQASGSEGICFLNSVVGAIIAPFIIGLIADRYFNAEKY